MNRLFYRCIHVALVVQMKILISPFGRNNIQPVPTVVNLIQFTTRPLSTGLQQVLLSVKKRISSVKAVDLECLLFTDNLAYRYDRISARSLTNCCLYCIWRRRGTRNCLDQKSAGSKHFDPLKSMFLIRNAQGPRCFNFFV